MQNAMGFLLTFLKNYFQLDDLGGSRIKLEISTSVMNFYQYCHYSQKTHAAPVFASSCDSLHVLLLFFSRQAYKLMSVLLLYFYPITFLILNRETSPFLQVKLFFLF